MRIPFVDLAAQYRSIRPELDAAIVNAINSFQFLKGKEVSQLESALASRLGVAHCIATGNGTDSLLLALKAVGIGPGDEVITPAFSWISSAEVISFCGARPVFADVDASNYTVAARSVERKITPATKAVIAVHLFGQAAEVAAMRNLCDDRGLFLVEDCAQAHFTAEGSRYAGTIGHVNAFSFYPTKNLGAYGDAGAITTNSDSLAERCRRLANHGALVKDDHVIEGLNSRMDTLQAAVLLAKLPHVNEWNEKRLSLARRYDQLLSGIDQITTPAVRPGTTHTFHLYVVRAQQRDDLKQFLARQGVETIIHYPKALPNLPTYRSLNVEPAAFPVADRLQHEVLSLPLYPELPDDAVNYVAEQVRRFYNPR